MSRQSKLIRVTGAAWLAAAGLALGACDANDSPAEEAGRAIDHAADDAADAIEDAGDRIDDAVDAVQDP